MKRTEFTRNERTNEGVDQRPARIIWGSSTYRAVRLNARSLSLRKHSSHVRVCDVSEAEDLQVFSPTPSKPLYNLPRRTTCRPVRWWALYIVL